MNRQSKQGSPACNYTGLDHDKWGQRRQPQPRGDTRH